jgi:hypothetical protein
MSKDAFLTKYLDELRGLCLEAFAEQERTKALKDKVPEGWVQAEKGKFMVNQLGRARSLLERIYADFEAKK